MFFGTNLTTKKKSGTPSQFFDNHGAPCTPYLTYGVIPICQPQRDVLTENQKKLIEKIEISTPSKAKNVIIQNRSEIVNIFDVIDQSLELTAIAYDRFRKL